MIDWAYVEIRILGGRLSPYGITVGHDWECMDEQIFAELRGWA